MCRKRFFLETDPSYLGHNKTLKTIFQIKLVDNSKKTNKPD